MSIGSSQIFDLTSLKSALPLDREDYRGKRTSKYYSLKFIDKSRDPNVPWKRKTAQLAPSVLYRVSNVVDASFLSAYNTLVPLIQSSREYQKGRQELFAASKNCGGFSTDTEIMRGLTPFEQMLALNELIQTRGPKWQKGRRTYCFSQKNDECVPIYVASREKTKASMMTVMLGTGNGRRKAPTYTELISDPTNMFVDPLRALEITRQPHFVGATVLKSRALAEEVISPKRRFEIVDENSPDRSSQFACVELVGQMTKKMLIPKQEVLHAICLV